MTIRAVFFDAGNTLIRMDYTAIVAALTAHGLAATLEDVQRADWHARVRLDVSFAQGTSTEHPVTSDRYLAYILEHLGVRDAATIRALADWKRDYNPPVGLWTAIEPDAAAALALARESGLRTACISNSNGTVEQTLDRLGLGRHLDFVLDSFKVGVEKPDPRIFHMAVARVGVPPEACAYVGDLYSVDVLGARAAGLHAVLMDPGACWGARDCAAAPSALHAVRLLLGG